MKRSLLEEKGKQFYIIFKQLVTLVSVFDCRKKPGWAQPEGLWSPGGSGGNSAVSISFVAAAAVDGQWQEWSSWSQCSVTCSNGTQQRSRQCTAAAHGGSECRGPWAESRECYNPECTGEYGAAPAGHTARPGRQQLPAAAGRARPRPQRAAGPEHLHPQGG